MPAAGGQTTARKRMRSLQRGQNRARATQAETYNRSARAQRAERKRVQNNTKSIADFDARRRLMWEGIEDAVKRAREDPDWLVDELNRGNREHLAFSDESPEDVYEGLFLTANPRTGQRRRAFRGSVLNARTQLACENLDLVLDAVERSNMLEVAKLEARQGLSRVRRRLRNGSTGGASSAVQIEFLCALLFQTFGIGHIVSGNFVTGITLMVGYWLLPLVNLFLAITCLIGFVTGPLTWIGFLLASLMALHAGRS